MAGRQEPLFGQGKGRLTIHVEGHRNDVRHEDRLPAGPKVGSTGMSDYVPRRPSNDERCIGCNVFLNPRERQPESQLDRARPSASYPALRRLHIVLSWGDVVVPDLLGWWSKAAPDVTDIRVTNVGQSDGGRDWLESMIDEDRMKRPYPSVRRMFVEPYQKPVGGRCATPRARHKYFMREMKRLRRRAPEDVEFVLKGRETKGQPLDRVADVERYWMDSVNEGPGGWRLPTT